MRPQFKQILQRYSQGELATLLSTTKVNIKVSKHRGYLSKLLAGRAETRLGGRFKAKLLVKK